jgi:pimeloyl-ACP methyl ester carboxylesterase
LDHFEITSDTGSSIGSQSVGSLFNIKVMAKDTGGNVKTGWNGPVMLSSTSGPVYPIEVQIVNGQWSGNVIIFKPGFAVQLTAMGAGASGSSNSFSVTGGSTSIGALQGSVRDSSASLVNGASVYISDTSYGTPIDQRTAVNGSFAFNSLACMRYYIWAEFDQSGTIYKSLAKQVDVRCGQVSTAYLTITVSGAAGKTPVLLVPGMMGSYWINPRIPTMPPWRPDWDSDNLYLYDWEKSVGWGNLQDELKNHGYVPNVTLFAVPYDWRLDLDSTVNKYLKKWIELAKTRAGTDKVDIVAHSMGGLIARAYIQSSGYANDINKFAMVGTPNHGSANAYYLYEGGDPITADVATGGIIGSRIYTLILNNQVFGNLLANPLTDPLYSLHIRNYLHRHVPAAKQVLPTYDLLIPVIGSVRGLQCEENNWLKDLNSSSNLSRLGKEDDTGPNKVKTKVFMGDNKDTILNIYSRLKFCANPLYPDGAPVGPLTQKTSDGDGTVLQTSTFLNNAVSYFVNEQVTGEHMKLINVYKKGIVDFLVNGVAPSATMRQDSAAAGEISAVYITLNGSMQFYVTAPDTKESGIKGGSLTNNISGGAVNFAGGAGSVAIENPVDGTYTVTITGTDPEDFTLAIGYSSASNNVNLSHRGYIHGTPIVFTFTINTALPSLTINHTPLPPTGLQANPVASGGLKTRLTWTASTSPDVTGYNIYRKYVDEPYLQQIGSVTDTTFNTNDPWASDTSIITSVYAVSAVKANGTESFLSEFAENDDRDHDGLTDAEETALGTDMNLADTDGDGLKDGDEIVYGTNPKLKDTDGDGYWDQAEIRSGSDPLDPQSIPAGTATIDAQPDAMNAAAPWTLTGPDSYSRTGTGDLTINNLASGDYTITWGAVLGWTTPALETKALTNGETTTFTGTYVQQTGSLTVTITPQGAINMDGQWRRVGTATWFNSGATETAIPVGSHTIEFKAISGWTTPGSQAVTVAKDQTATSTGTYIRQTGTVIINPDPNSISTPWTLTGPDSYSQSGTGDQTLSNVPTGSCTITWGAVSGWDKPSPASEMNAVTYGGTTTFSGTYVQQPISPGCSGDVIVLQNMTFTEGNTYNCTATTSITAGIGVTVQSGAIVNFRAPKINLKPGFKVESGAVFSAKQ